MNLQVHSSHRVEMWPDIWAFLGNWMASLPSRIGTQWLNCKVEQLSRYTKLSQLEEAVFLNE